MKATEIKSCYIGPEISPEQFISEHFFLYLAKGIIHGYDGNKKYTLRAGEYCLVRKNRLARNNKERVEGEFEKIVIVLDKVFLKKLQGRHKSVESAYRPDESFLILNTALIPDFIDSLMPYYDQAGRIDEHFADVKREELLLILLQAEPYLANVFFDFGAPEKIDMEEFMNRNYKFNTSIKRFAYLTGRSISAFKRDFKQTFNDTPNHWLVQKRLKEAYFLINKKHKKPSDIYLELGFEDLSHFSFAFKNTFGQTATQLLARKEESSI